MCLLNVLSLPLAVTPVPNRISISISLGVVSEPVIAMGTLNLPVKMLSTFSN